MKQIRILNSNGFTLMELSIVLVIIALIIGGVLVGKDLIKASEIRSTIRQKDGFDSAVNTFRQKYQCLPGDCAKASEFGLGARSSYSYGSSAGPSNAPDYALAENGDGDGQVGVTPGLRFCNSGNMRTGHCGDGGSIIEMVSFWMHMANAGLIEDTVSNHPPIYWPISGTNTPTIKLKRGTGWWIMSELVVASTNAWSYWPYGAINGKHVYWLTDTITNGTGWYANAGGDTATLLPIDALNIDQKIDDGLPLTGNVRAASNYNWSGPTQYNMVGAAGTSYCVNNSTTPFTYNVTATDVGADCNTDALACNLCSLVIGTTF